MNAMRLGLCVFTLAMFSGSLWAADWTYEVFPELKPLTQQALHGGSQSVLGGASAREAAATQSAGNGRLWPQVVADFSANHTIEDRSDISGNVTHDRYWATVNGTYPLYHWGAVAAEAKAGKELAVQIKSVSAQEQASLADSVLADYLALFIAQKKADSLARVRQSIEAQVNAPQATSDSSAPLVREERRLSLEQAKLEELKLKNETSEMAGRLHRQLGAPMELTYAFGGFPAKLTVPEVWRTVRPSAPTAQYLASVGRLERLRATQSRAEELPSADLLMGFYQDQVDGISVAKPVERNNYFVGVRVTWKLFDGWQAKNQRAAALARSTRARHLAQLEDTKTMNTFGGYLRTLEYLAGSYDISLARLRIAQERLASQTALAKQGQASPEALNAAQSATEDATEKTLTLLADYIKLYATAERMVQVPQNP